MKIKEYFMEAKTLRDGGRIEEKMWHTLDKYLKDCKEKDPDWYDDLCDCLYMDLYGMHFNESMLNKAYACMINDNGSPVPHWSVERCKEIAKEYGIKFNKFNEYDWAYVLNSMYADYCKIFADDTTTYVNLAEKFLDDKDAPDGGADKAMVYYMAMKDNR